MQTERDGEGGATHPLRAWILQHPLPLLGASALVLAFLCWPVQQTVRAMGAFEALPGDEVHLVTDRAGTAHLATVPRTQLDPGAKVLGITPPDAVAAPEAREIYENRCFAPRPQPGMGQAEREAQAAHTAFEAASYDAANDRARASRAMLQDGVPQVTPVAGFLVSLVIADGQRVEAGTPFGTLIPPEAGYQMRLLVKGGLGRRLDPLQQVHLPDLDQAAGLGKKSKVFGTLDFTSMETLDGVAAKALMVRLNASTDAQKVDPKATYDVLFLRLSAQPQAIPLYLLYNLNARLRLLTRRTPRVMQWLQS